MGLYVVATPIGNLEDMTFRAVRVLREVDRVLCEDTRVTRKLCQHYGISAPLLRHEAHNEAASTAGVLKLLAQGERLALVSDAGTPGVSDPGQRLVRAVAEAGFEVIVLPGASAVTTAVSGSGLGRDGFSFHGFLPKKARARSVTLKALPPGTHVFFVPARDLDTVVAALAAQHPEAPTVVGRELTKAHESWYRGRPSEVAEAIAEDPGAAKGEAVVVLEVPADVVHDEAIVVALAAARAAGATTKSAVDQVSRQLGVERRRVYRLAHA